MRGSRQLLDSECDAEPMELYEVQDAARVLGVGPATVRRLADEGVLAPAAVTPRGARLFTPATVAKLKAKRDAKARETR